MSWFVSVSVGEAEGSVDQTIPIVLTQQELAALVQQQQQLQNIHNQPEPEPAEPEPHHSMPTGRPAAIHISNRNLGEEMLSETKRWVFFWPLCEKHSLHPKDPQVLDQ